MACDAAQADWGAFYAQLQRYVGPRVRNAADADDLVQVILERALSKRTTDAEIENVTAWLFAIARNAVFDHHRARQRALAHDASDAAGPVLDETPSTTFERDEVLACMWPLLNALPAEPRQLLEWADMQDRPLQAIADELGISLTATKSRVQRARKLFVDITQRCCTVTLDARGRVNALTPKRPSCTNPCDPSPDRNS